MYANESENQAYYVYTKHIQHFMDTHAKSKDEGMKRARERERGILNEKRSLETASN